MSVNHLGGDARFKSLALKGTLQGKPFADMSDAEFTDFKTSYDKVCAVLNCEETNEPELYFSFPDDATIRQVWIEMTGRSNWVPTDDSYICDCHFEPDCFLTSDNDSLILSENAVPSLKLPNDVMEMEMEYIDEKALEELEKGEHLGDVNISSQLETSKALKNLELLKLFSQVQFKQRHAVTLKDRLNYDLKLFKKQSRAISRLKECLKRKEKLIKQKKISEPQKNNHIQDRLSADTNALISTMPLRYTDDVKNFALSIYKYSPEAYIYLRNALRTVLPSTELVNKWREDGFVPKNVIQNGTAIKVYSEVSESEVQCKISIN